MTEDGKKKAEEGEEAGTWIEVDTEDGGKRAALIRTDGGNLLSSRTWNRIGTRASQ